MPAVLTQLQQDDGIERELERPFWRLNFEPSLERSFETDIAARRTRHNLICLAALIVLYDLALIPDWLQSPDTFTTNVLLRLAVFTPLCILAMALIRRGVPTIAQEWMVGILLILTVQLEALRLPWRDFDADSAVYQVGGGLCCMVFAAVVVKIRFSITIAAILAMCVIKIGFIWAAPGEFSDTGRGIITHALVSGVLMLLLAAFLLERADRAGYLHRLRAEVLNTALQAVALTDGLTGLGNRRHLAEVMTATWNDHPADGLVSVILIDIDHFKLFNDTYGHVEGDACLRRVSACVRTALTQPGHLAFRYGGEELLILLVDADHTDARSCASRIRDALQSEAIPHEGLRPDARLTVSMGVATTMRAEASATELIALADTALYAAKHAGRDRIVSAASLSENSKASG